MIGMPNADAARPAVAAPPGWNDSSEPTGARMTGTRSLRPNRVVTELDLGDVDANAGTQREGVEGEAVAAEGGFGFGGADEVAPDVVGQLGAGGGDELMQALEVACGFEKMLGFGLVHGFPRWHVRRLSGIRGVGCARVDQAGWVVF